MTLNFHSVVLLSLAALCSGCVDSQLLGDPEGTGGEGETEGVMGSTGTPEGGTDPEGTESGSSSESGTTDDPGSCLPEGAACAAQLFECCEGTTCSPDTGLCEIGDNVGEDLCSDYAPPPAECPEQGETRVGLDVDASFSYGESIPCDVVSLESDEVDRWTVGLNCDDLFPTFTYQSAAPYLGPPIDVGASVLYTAVDDGTMPMRDASVALHTPEGELLFAYVDAFDLDVALPVDIAPLEVAFAGTGCAGFDAGAALCDVKGESIVGARVSVGIGADDPVSIADGNSASVTVGDAQYRVSVGEATQIVCTNGSCASDESGPYDRLRMLIVAEQL
jgi:hypothetical protein